MQAEPSIEATGSTEEYIRLEVPKFPTAILSSAMTLAGLLGISVGLVLDTVTRGRREMKRMRYLEIPALIATLVSRRADR